MESQTPRPADTPAQPQGSPTADLMAVIASAKARGADESLERWLLKRFPEATEEELAETADVCIEIIDSIPVFLARAHQEAEARGLESLVVPLLAHAERYFLQPVDFIPEMTHGMAGLLDDAYLVLRTLQNLEKGPEPFLDWDLEYPTRFLRSLLGEEIAGRLDAYAMEAMRDVSQHLSEMWARMAHDA